MSTTRMRRNVSSSRRRVYRALLDARAVSTWMVPDGMRSHVHEFAPYVGGAFRISLTYDAPDAAGKTSANTDTYHGRFVVLVPDTRVVQTMEFETGDPTMRGLMTVTFELRDANGGTAILAVHEGVPSGVAPADNETGWLMALDKLAAYVEAKEEAASA